MKALLSLIPNISESLKVRESVRFVPSKQVATPGDEGKGDNSLTT